MDSNLWHQCFAYPRSDACLSKQDNLGRKEEEMDPCLFSLFFNNEKVISTGVPSLLYGSSVHGTRATKYSSIFESDTQRLGSVWG
mmetsp:Transcript_6302/g.11476  ORF Transcript_6302/g.11476 Transcript_6302/m.11476 type:complete len:85 (-) Transcript_6302:47-301(-)